MAQLVILGHKTRSKEVIEILEMLGGRNSRDYVCNVPGYAYSIDEQGIIDLYISHSNSSITFTLEEFLEKFPYKVGDKVRAWVNGYRGVFDIRNITWDSIAKEVKYRIYGYWHSAENLQLYKEETMEENTDTALAPDLKGEDYSGRRFGYKIPKGYEFECVRNNEIILKPIKPQYPKTYEECCKVLNLTKYPPALVPNKAAYINQYKDFPYYYEIQKLAELLVCRNAYWKIAGEQMGLGKPWEPDLENEELYCIQNYNNQITISRTNTAFNKILIFPTEEMRDAFYENFKDLIEACKELLEILNCMPLNCIKGIRQLISDRKNYQVFLKSIQPGTKWKCCGSMLPVNPFDDEYLDSIVTIVDIKKQEYYDELWIKYKHDISGKVSTMLAKHFEKEFKQVNS